MFLTNEDELLVNEVAPRPHNSYHFSIEGSYTSQFEQFSKNNLRFTSWKHQNSKIL